MKPLIKTILYEWKDKKLPSILPRETKLSKFLQTKPRKVIAVTGFRRVGKTYLCWQLIEKLLKNYDKEEIIYINFEDERIPLKTEFLTELLPSIKTSFDKKLKVLVLDEVHNIPLWSKWLRRISDNENIQIFVTGSSSKMSSREIPTELRGRCLEAPVLPLSFDEFLQFKNIEFELKAIGYSQQTKGKLQKALEEYLNFGALPEVVLTDKNNKLEILQQYYKTVIQRDIVERFKVKNQENLKAVLLLLLNSTYYSISKLYNNLKSLNYKIGKTTLLHYASYIENSYFLYSLPIFSYKIKNQLQYPRKAYFIDNGFINALSTKFARNLGRLYENLVFITLKRKKGLNSQLFYWKNQSGKEVDFVIKKGLKIKQLIQVCYDLSNSETKKREVKSLLKASKELKCSNLLIITQDFEGEERIQSKKIKFAPLWKWLLK